MSTQLPGLWADLSVWISFLISLAIFSLVVRENKLARAAQFLLVGTSLGYAALLAWHNVLRPRLILPLLWGPERPWPLWVAAGLALLLCLAGVAQFGQGDGLGLLPRRVRGLATAVGLLPLGLLLGATLGATLIGNWQGLLRPQFLRAAELGQAVGGGLIPAIIGLSMLLISAGVLLFLVMDVERHLPLPPVPTQLFRIWISLGQRAVWLASGVLFARLMAARIALLVAWYDQMLIYLEATGLWQWAESVWRALLG